MTIFVTKAFLVRLLGTDGNFDAAKGRSNRIIAPFPRAILFLQEIEASHRDEDDLRSRLAGLAAVRIRYRQRTFRYLVEIALR